MSRDLPERASVVVIGGGVIGTSVAFHLAESGVRDVVLVERDELASGSTCKAAGGVRASFSNAANIAIGLRGLQVYARFARDFGQDIDFSRDGCCRIRPMSRCSPSRWRCRTAWGCRAG
jgi:sarcosine oxidase, subunit beta